MKCKLIDFKVIDEKCNEKCDSELSESENHTSSDSFTIQLFGIDKQRKTYSIFVEDYRPYMFAKIPSTWTSKHVRLFVDFLNRQLLHRNASILKSVVVKYKKLYGFDGGAQYKFVQLFTKSNREFNALKYLWYTTGENRTLKPGGIKYKTDKIPLYEAHIPPLLRFFHERSINPSGWIEFDDDSTNDTSTHHRTNCTFELSVSMNDINAIQSDESVPYKICSFDIEASSSHGDFPLPIKSYNKLANEIVDYSNKYQLDKPTMKSILLYVFHLSKKKFVDISVVYPKTKTTLETISDKIEKILNINNIRDTELSKCETIETMLHVPDSDDECEGNSYRKNVDYEDDLISFINDKKLPKDDKVTLLNQILTNYLPPLKGDIVTFIGSTFMDMGTKEIYKNNCIVLNNCDKLNEIENSEIICCTTEREVLLQWTKLIQKEDPDIIIGYNIFGFDYEFMFRRACETNCVPSFLKLSRNVDELCGTKDKNGYNIQESVSVLASGQHNLKFINIPGRIQIDLYNSFRRDYNLDSYKLDNVAGYFIGDTIYKTTNESDSNAQRIYSKNLFGLSENAFVHFQEIGHTNEYVNNGQKYKVVKINSDEHYFDIRLEDLIVFDETKKLRWCLAKDDVTPKDIFELTKGTDADRAIIAKYCIQDCNLVHSLLNKIDILTGLIEMANLCSVPISFLVLRGQGIKLTSFIAKKCREKGTLMPTLKSAMGNDEGYEGAIVLEPKCNLYLDNPVACVDYGSLYPSSMISENLCHSSKVWTKEYNLDGELLETTGVQCGENGDFLYDNLPNHSYVDVTYDTYKYERKSPKAAALKVKIGTKTCRFAKADDGMAIMPSVLQELLQSRKATKKQMGKETDPFMKNILDKRQLSIKLTANSLYGQCGAKTSAFYEKDVAACTTATGRKLLIYAKNLIEGVYGDAICDTKDFGKVRTNAEYIYGDTDSVFFTFNLKKLDTNETISGKDALAITIELAQEAGELATKFLKAPHDLEYEKTFMPFCLLSKKRYVGMLYETDVNKCKSKSMGIVLKRRDNAPIVKDIYGGIIDILMKDKNIQKSLDFLDESLSNILTGDFPFDKFLITKSLRSGYKNPNQIAHKVLADRIGQRDPGNKPAPGDRIPFAFIVPKVKPKLQGDKIETPTFIHENKLKLDYNHYITNQIMKPVIQIFSLVLFDLPCLKKRAFQISSIRNQIKMAKNTLTQDAFKRKEEQIKNKVVEKLLFKKYIDMSKTETKDISSFFKETETPSFSLI